MKRILPALLFLACSAANAQFVTGQILTAARLNAAFANVLSTSGGTLTGPLTVPSLNVTGMTNFSNVGITGGTITGLSAPIPLASGGTNATTATGATSQLQYLQGATGSVATPLDLKFRQVVSVQDFGATGLNVVDDSAAFLAASAVSRSVYVPPGNYKIAASILESNPVTFIGSGVNATQIFPVGNFDVFAFSGSGNGGGLRNMTVNASGMTGGNIVSNIGQGRFLLQNLQLVNGCNGIYLQDFNVTTIDSVYLNAQTCAYGIKSFGSGTGANNVLDMNNVEIGFATNTAASPVGIWIDGDAATTDMRHVAVVKGFRGLQVTNSANLTLGPSFITAYSFQADFQYDAGIYLDGGTGSTQTHQFMNPYIHGSLTGAGIVMTSSVRNIVINGGQIDSNAQQGILNNGRYVKITDVQVSNNSASGSSAFAGIEIGATSFATSISGGLSGIWSGYAANIQSYGVQVDAGAVAYNVGKINLVGNVSGPYIDSANDPNSQIAWNSASTSTVNKIAGPIQSTTGALTLQSGSAASSVLIGSSNGVALQATSPNASTVNSVQVFGSITGVAPVIQSVGDANASLKLSSSGTGSVFVSNPLVAQNSLSHAAQEIDKSYVVSTPTTGATVTMTTGTESAVIAPAGTLAALTVALPSCTAGYDGSIARYSSSQTITALTVSSASSTVSNAPSTLAPGIGNAYICRGSSTTWYRLY